jgi:hypothetical protein
MGFARDVPQAAQRRVTEVKAMKTAAIALGIALTPIIVLMFLAIGVVPGLIVLAALIAIFAWISIAIAIANRFE